MCRSCREDAVFNFEAVKCIPSSNCQPWQPYVTLVLVVIFQLVLGFGIVIGLKASFKTGIGHLYGPLFLIAVLRLIPFGYYKEYVQLKFIVSIFQSILLLNLEIFGVELLSPFSWSIYYCSCTIINSITSSILSKTILVSTEFTSSSYLSPDSSFLLVCF